jgi:predicted GIY-YIG superfamily endonuclease
MCYVYVLMSLKDNERYIGSSVNLAKRLVEHRSGLVKSTVNRRPLRLIAVQNCDNISDARRYEYEYKKSRGRYEHALKNGVLVTIGD